MRIVINPSFKCNLECEYCYLQGKKTHDTVFAHDVVDRAADDWIRGILWLETQYSQATTLDISGGEPFLYPHIIELIKKFPLRIFIGLTTNAILTPRSFFELREERRNNMHIVLSMHLDQNGWVFNKFVEKLPEFRRNFNSLIINFVSYPQQKDKISYAKSIADKFNIPLHVEPYIDYNEEVTRFGGIIPTHDDEFVWNWLSETDKNAIKCVEERKYPTDCFIGDKYFWITPDGNIYNCLGRFLEKHYPVGNIFEHRIYEQTPIPYSCQIFCPCAQNWRDGIR